jgi:hypothetical protein
MKLFEFKTYKNKAGSKTTINIPTITLFLIALILGIWMAVQLWPWEGLFNG